MDGGGDGPPTLRLGGKPFIMPLEPPEFGGDISWPRLLGYGPSFWLYLDMLEDHSFPPRDTGESGAFRPFIVRPVCVRKEPGLASPRGKSSTNQALARVLKVPTVLFCSGSSILGLRVVGGSSFRRLPI
jgi:hypothetical protein